MFLGGRGRVGVIYPTIWATVGTTGLWTLNEIPLVQIERSGNLFGFRAYLSSFLCCNLQNIETKAVSFIQFYELYFQPKHIGYDLMLTYIHFSISGAVLSFFHGSHQKRKSYSNLFITVNNGAFSFKYTIMFKVYFQDWL